MKKQFAEFEATFPDDFKEIFIEWIMVDEVSTKEEVIEAYFAGTSFDDFFQKVAGRVCTFKPDLGYANEDLNGRYCFEIQDNNWCIPVVLLTSPRNKE